MQAYRFSFLNHYGESFDTRTLMCEDEAHAIECGRFLTARGYVVRVCEDERVVAILNPNLTELFDWLALISRVFFGV